MNRILALSLALALLAGAAPAAIDADLVNEATVLLKAEHAGGATEIGSGVVVCVKDGHAYILTAKHVLESEPGKRARGLGLTVSFFKNRWPAATGAAAGFEYKWAQTKDLALVKVKLSGEGPRPITIGDSRGIAVGSGIATTGHPVDLQTEWVFRKGDLSKKGEFLEYDAAVSQGYSGGPLLNEDGDLVGINVVVKKGTQGASLARAIPVNEVLTTIENWLDMSCLQRASGPGTPGGPAVVSGGDVDGLADQYWAARDRDETSSTWFGAWYDRMHAAMDGDDDFVENDLLMLEMAGLVIPADGQTVAEDDLEVIDAALENLGLDDGKAAGGIDATGPTGQPGGPVSVDHFTLTAYSEPSLGMLAPPNIYGEMTVTEATPDYYRVEMSVQLMGANYVTVFDGMIQGGSLFTGTVVDSNLWPAGTGVVINLFYDGYNLTMTLPDGTVYQWAEQ